MIIGILGEKRHGKDTIGDYLCDIYHFKKESIAKPVKDICRILFGFTDEQLYGDLKEIPDVRWNNLTPRKAMQYIGTEFGQMRLINDITELKTFGRHIWTKSMLERLESQLNYVVTDVRFQHEVDTIKNEGGTIIKVVRPSLISEDSHASEQELRSITNYDFMVVNDGTIDDLKVKIDRLMEVV